MRVFEVVDVTGDEVYWTVGMFASVELAEEAIRDTIAETGEPPRSVMCDDYRVDLELRERECGLGESHKTIWKRSWVEELDESTDEFVWLANRPNPNPRQPE